MNNFWDSVFGLITVMVIIAIGAFMVGAAVLTPLAYGICESKAAKMGFEASWGPLQDCMIKVNGRFVPLSSYRTARVTQ